MALPSLILASGGIGGYQPPIKSSKGNFYVTVRAADNDPAIYKSSDAGETDAWALTDDANGPINSGTACISWAQAGDVSYLAYTANGATIDHANFNMATDLWVVIDDPTGIGGAAPNPTVPWCSIAVRNDGDIIVVGSGATEGVKGGDKERVDVVESTNGGTTWGTVTALDAAEDFHYGNPTIVKGPLTDDMHIQWMQTANTADPPTAWEQWEARTLDGANSLSTLVTEATDTGGNLLGLANAVAYEDGGTQRIAIRGALDTTDVITWRSTEDGSDDIQAATASTDTDDIFVNGEVGILSIAVHEGTLHCVFSGGGTGGVDQDIYYTSSTDDGATWATPTEIEDAVTCNYISCAVLQRKGNIVLGYVYDNAGSVYYNEHLLTNLSYTQLDNGSLDNLVNTHVGPIQI